MDRRLELHEKLVEIMDQFVLEDRPKVFFQPPSSIHLTYPCIIYQLDNIDTLYANDTPYLNYERYQVTIIDRDPDSKIPEAVGKLPTSRFGRFFTSDNLNHFIYNVYC